MKKYFLIAAVLTATWIAKAQDAGYYNGTEGKTGDELKAALHEIIKGHVDFSYSDAKYIMNYSDQDPENASNMILFYTRRSQKNTSWGGGNNEANREHVWAKSHGDFADIRPMDGDVFNLHPADASVNKARLHYDFDSVPRTATYLDEADAWIQGSAYKFEPADVSKGRVARTIFYMAVRYEGTNDEMDLEVVDAVNTSAKAEHGKLSTLLKWNKQFPPDDFERRRNNRIYEAQRNRNPFIDHPEFADLIWGEKMVDPISVGGMTMTPMYPTAGTKASISVNVASSMSSEQASATLYWDTQYDGERNSTPMNASDMTFSADLDFTNIAEGTTVYYKVIASAASSSKVLHGSYRLPQSVTLTDIKDVQGTGNSSPMVGQNVTVAGIVTSNLDGAYYIQSDTQSYSGMCIYDIKRGKLGDSIVVTGTVTEYNNLTEINKLTDTYVYPKNGVRSPVEVNIEDIDESYEGMLVKIKNANFKEGGSQIPYDEQSTFTLNQGSKSISVYNRYNSRLGGKTLPSGTVDVLAIVSQYKTNYQLLINSIDDITAGEDFDAPVITAVNVLDKDWISVQFNEKLNKESAENTDNYTFSGDINVIMSSLYEETSALVLVTGINVGDYTLTVNGVKDLQGNAVDNASFNFVSDVSSAVDALHNNGIEIYPNPVKGGQVFINADHGIETVTLLSISGKEIMKVSSNGQREMHLSTQNIKNGVYLILLKKTDGSLTKQQLIIGN